MSRARELAKLANTDAIGIDGVDVRTGSIAKGTQLDVASNVNVIGVITATNFIGNASGLTGLGAVGSGVTVLRANNSLGAITKLNFDSTFTVTDPASGLSTVTSGVTTADPRSASLVVAGISTLQNVTAGVVTANQFSGSLTGVAVTVAGQSTLSNLNVSSGIVTVAGQTTLSNLNVSGVTTAGIVTVNNNLFSANSTLAGITTITELNIVSDLEIAGFSTISNGGLDVVGVVTASSYRGDGSQLSGISAGVSTAQVHASGLVVSGISTLADATFSGFTTFTIGNYGSGKVVDFVSDQGGSGGGLSISHESGNPYGVFMRFHSHDNDLATITTDSNSNMVIDTGANLALRAGGIELAHGNALSTKLYCSNNQKLGTSQSGVTVTGGVVASGINTAGGINVSGIITSTGHVDSGITTYYGDNSYSASGRWVLGADGSNHYTFTGPGLGHSTQNDPTLYLKRGQTYLFENKMGAHPFRIQSTSNGAAGTAWNVGVTNNDVANGVLIFEVPFVTPDTLYYQCTAHANMGGVINIA